MDDELDLDEPEANEASFFEIPIDLMPAVPFPIELAALDEDDPDELCGCTCGCPSKPLPDGLDCARCRLGIHV